LIGTILKYLGLLFSFNSIQSLIQTFLIGCMFIHSFLMMYSNYDLRFWNSNDDGNIGTSIGETTIRFNKFCPTKINFDIESPRNGMGRCIIRFVSFQDHSHDYGSDKHIFNTLCANLNWIEYELNWIWMQHNLHSNGTYFLYNQFMFLIISLSLVVHSNVKLRCIMSFFLTSYFNSLLLKSEFRKYNIILFTEFGK
jgi:hypothetical protein